MALVRPSQALRVPLQTKTRPRPFNNPARNASCLPDTCRALHTIAPAAHDATKVNTKNGRGLDDEERVRLLGTGESETAEDHNHG